MFSRVQKGAVLSVTDLYEFEDPQGSVSAGSAFAPPQDMAAEQSVLGAMLLSKNAIDPATDVLEGRDFYRPAHETIFDVISDLANRGEPADAITVAAELTRQGEIAKIGGAAYLHDLVQSTPIAANVDYYAEIVREKAILRRLVAVGQRIAQLGQSGQGEVATLVDDAQAAVLDVDGASAKEDYRLLFDVAAAAIDELETIQMRTGEVDGVLSGFPDLDRLTTGFKAGQMIVIAARPGVGKSTLGLDIVRNAAIRQGKTAAIFSLEMSASEIVMRLLSAEARVAINHMRGGTMGEREWTAISAAVNNVQSAGIVIDDSPNMTMPEIRSKARRIKKQYGLDIIVLDYLQLMSSGKRVESRQVEVSEFSRQIKLLAKELEVPIIAISQLNRGSEQRTDKTPQLSDLRESGSIEQDADIVMLLNRPDATGAGESERPGEADIIVAKNRSGPVNKVGVVFQGHYSRFAPAARDVEPPDSGISASDFA